MKIVALDIDGCLADFNTSYGKLLANLNGKDLCPEGWEMDPEFPKVWNWERAAGYSTAVENATWKTIVGVGNKFWQELTPYTGVPETLGKLNESVKAGKINLYFLTDRMGDRAKLQTEKWLYEYGVDYPTVILGGDKVPFLKTVRANFFIDDKPSTLVTVYSVSKNENWPDFSLYALDMPYNREVPQVKRAASVFEAMKDAGVL